MNVIVGNNYKEDKLMKNNNNMYEREIYECLKELGASPDVTGYHYASYIISNMLSNKFNIMDKLGYVYQMTGIHFNSTASRVERAIRHMVESVFMTAPVEVVGEYFGNVVSFNSGKVTNGQFIASIVQYIKINNTESTIPEVI